MHTLLKMLMLRLGALPVGAAAALLAAGCGSTGTSAGPGDTGTSTMTGSGSGSVAASTGSAAATPPSLDVTGTAFGSSNPAGKATVFGCDGQPVSQPKTYTLACGDGGTLLDGLVWTGWGKAKAMATGVLVRNSCRPSCAAGAPVSAKATVTLSGLNSGHYSELSVVTAKGTDAYTINDQGPLVTRSG